MEPPEHGGHKDLVDRMVGRKRPEDFTNLDEWKRQESEREAARHPWREKLTRWAAVGVLLIVGLAALAFMSLYLYHVFFLTPPV